MDLSAALRVFLRTVERGSMTGAGEDLSLSQPAVSKHLANLERHVQARLFERSSRAVRPTLAGQALYERSRSALAELDAAIEGVRLDQGRIEGSLRIHAPSCVGARAIHPIVMGYRDSHPDVAVTLILENRSVDLIYENFDLAIRYGRPDVQDLVVRRLGLVQRVLAASPGFLAAHGSLETIEQLQAVPLVVSSNVLTPRGALSLSQGKQRLEVDVSPSIHTNDANVIAQTLLSGHAAGPVQTLLVNDALADGRLVRILPRYEVKPAEMFLAYPSLRYMRSVVRSFADELAGQLARIDGIA
ncbi:LysR family transcriptional regulator [Aurantimonas sp. VKM B-3413]|uniref:LysR family transcriptional regulator n=1 Tax=Aurantimonas sp. VKM B-3413 TaxID=2779401 RepID=UPI001E3FE927|nr:LysR family transcriptional regulator [Aurantimonas sp. VKM B-3413]MCB8838517.1 LysR family transcriptional regulator [Aurantimonas sp. VKM B-3413]